MPLPKIDIHYLGTVYSPFSGQVVETDDGSNTSDPTLLLVYYGDADIWDYVSPRVADRLPDPVGSPEDLYPDELVALLEIDGAIVMVVDAEWNGIN